MKTTILYRAAFIAVLCLGAIACEKQPGPGGRSTITGRVFANDFYNTQRFHIGEGYAAGERVYILYGDDSRIGDNVRTTSDGTFEFRYLQKGHYKIFVNSLDTSIKMKGNKTMIPVFREVDVNGKKGSVDIGEITINK